MGFRQDLARLNGREFYVACRAEKWGLKSGRPWLCVTDLLTLGLGTVPLHADQSVTLANRGLGQPEMLNGFFELDHMWIDGPTRDVIRPGDWLVFTGESYSYDQPHPSGATKEGNAINCDRWERCWRAPDVKPERTAFLWVDHASLQRLFIGIDSYPQDVLMKEPIYRPVYDIEATHLDDDRVEWKRSVWRIEVPLDDRVCDWHTFKRTVKRPYRDVTYEYLVDGGRLSEHLFWKAHTTPPCETWVSIVRDG
jgi:hypothetical protein